MDVNSKNFIKAVFKHGANMPVDAVIKVQKKLAIQALRRVIMKTPVDTGRARGNWQLTINKLPSGELDVEVGDKHGKPLEKLPPLKNYGQKSLEAGLKNLKDLGAFQIVYIANNVNYIIYLEDGTSKQAPEGMVAITMQELADEYK